VALDWDRGSCIPSSTVGHNDDRPFLLILHGVFGGSEENYVRQIAWSAKQYHSLRFAILNFRGAGTSVLRTPKAYCAGSTEDVRLVLRLLKARCSLRYAC
jgi:predicted alpha/beta-fold hydrolase